jgi:2'-5' RNA ligase
MRHRIFIAINLPEKIKNELISFQNKWPELPIRWTKKENLHITLVFLGYLRDERLGEVCKITKEVASKHHQFLINMNKIYYGPPKKSPPRMVWVEVKKNEILAKLQSELESSFLRRNMKILAESETRTYSPHITLGRIRQWEFRKMEPEERPEINEEINLAFKVNSIEVMESQLKRSGAEYTILKTCSLSS